MHEMEECYFSKINKCRCSESSDYATAGSQRIQTIINCSKKYDDNLHQNLQECLDNDSEYSHSYTQDRCFSIHFKATG